MPVRAELVPNVVTVEAGGAATFTVTLVNGGDAAETVSVKVQGEMGRMAWVLPESVTVAPGERQAVKVGFRLPTGASIAAGPLPFSLTNGAGGPVLSEGVVEVLPFAALSATLDGDRVTVSTRGNAPVDVALTVTADEGVDASVEPESVRVAPDQPASATVVRASTQTFNSPRSFTVRAAPATGDAPAEVRGTFAPTAAVRSLRPLVIVGVVVALVAAAAAFGIVSGGGGSGGTDTAVDVPAPSGTVDARTRCPAEFHANDPSASRTLTPEDIKTLPDDYSFLRIKDDKCSPMRFNPCEPMHFIQNAAAAPPGVAEDTRTAFRMLGEATGITFIDDGLTDETARTDPYVPARYGQRWAPILILWEHFGPERTDGAVQILGNTFPFRVDDIVVSARLRFNVDSYNNEQTKAPIQSGFGPPGPPTSEPIGRDNITWGRIVLHELVHLAGLGHTRSQGSLMYPDAAQQTIRPVGFSDGDRVGLRLVGREAGCLRTPPLPI
ncbi:MAG: matrixin family metalloprotease [Acidimicrobiales bacterium]